MIRIINSIKWRPTGTGIFDVHSWQLNEDVAENPTEIQQKIKIIIQQHIRVYSPMLYEHFVTLTVSVRFIAINFCLLSLRSQNQ